MPLNQFESLPSLIPADSTVPEVAADHGEGFYYRVVYKYAPGGAFWRVDVLAASAEDARDSVVYAQRQDGTHPVIFAVIPLASVI